MGNQCCCGLSPKDIRRNKRRIWHDLIFLKIFQFLKIQTAIAGYCASLGSLYSSLREYDKAEQMLIKAIELHQKYDFKEIIAHNFYTLGYTYLFHGKYDKAVDSFLKAQSYFKQAGRDYFYKMMFESLGSAYMSKGDLNKAEEMYLKATKAYEELKIENQFFLQLGHIYRLKGEFEKAEKVLLNSLEKVENTDRGCIISLYLSLGKVYEGKKEKEKEKDCLQKAVDILKDNGSKELVEKLQKRIADLDSSLLSE